MNENNDDMHKYDDMLHLPHHVSKNHPQMSLHDRAAQFSPFAALTGHEDRIRETARLTDRKIELDEYGIALLNDKLRRVKEQLHDRPVITVTYFQPDGRKAGGEYLTVTGAVKKIDEYRHQVVFCDGRAVDIRQIFEIGGI